MALEVLAIGKFPFVQNLHGLHGWQVLSLLLGLLHRLWKVIDTLKFDHLLV